MDPNYPYQRQPEYYNAHPIQPYPNDPQNVPTNLRPLPFASPQYPPYDGQSGTPPQAHMAHYAQYQQPSPSRSPYNYTPNTTPTRQSVPVQPPGATAHFVPPSQSYPTSLPVMASAQIVPGSQPGFTASASSSPTPIPAAGYIAGHQERFACQYCDKTFSRNHDRKRHTETHVPGSSGNNRCPYCNKDYSRADSLKRHLDNGCDHRPR